MAEDYAAINVYTAGYDTHFFAGVLNGAGANLIDISTMLLERVVSRKTRIKPVLFITHSLGGLIAKQMLRKASEASSARRKRVIAETLGVVFVGTPHQGAQLAKSINSALSIAASQQMKDLSYAHSALIDLSEWFRNWAPQTKLQISSFYEVEHYKGVLVVDQVTANPNVLGCDPVALQANHVDLVKLSDRKSQLYQSLNSTIDELIESQSIELSIVGDQSAQTLIVNGGAKPSHGGGVKAGQSGRGRGRSRSALFP
ncbi:hypothetical protein GGQ85_004403, partial [Nitrobacter vulgaris]|uniref:esterase/lipase family protein n=1 Tax=Nitrobacter vulgaris TaxID=29421 RepID=UPI0028564360